MTPTITRTQVLAAFPPSTASTVQVLQWLKLAIDLLWQIRRATVPKPVLTSDFQLNGYGLHVMSTDDIRRHIDLGRRYELMIENATFQHIEDLRRAALNRQEKLMITAAEGVMGGHF